MDVPLEELTDSLLQDHWAKDQQTQQTLHDLHRIGSQQDYSQDGLVLSNKNLNQRNKNKKRKTITVQRGSSAHSAGSPSAAAWWQQILTCGFTLLGFCWATTLTVLSVAGFSGGVRRFFFLPQEKHFGEDYFFYRAEGAETVEQLIRYSVAGYMNAPKKYTFSSQFFLLFKYLLFLGVGPIERYYSGKCFGRSMLNWHLRGDVS